jgi:predicted nucleotidyltransferase
VDFFGTDPRGVAAVYLFGSTARGSARPQSDIDLGILFTETPAANIDAQPYDLEAALERLFGRPVGAILLNRAAIDLRSRVLPEGRLIVERNRSLRIAFEVRTRRGVRPRTDSSTCTATTTSTWRSRDVVEHRLDDLIQFVALVRRRLGAPPR